MNREMARCCSVGFGVTREVLLRRTHSRERGSQADRCNAAVTGAYACSEATP